MPAFTFELELPPGLNSEDTAFAAKGWWADSNNVRFRGGKPEPIEGWGSEAFSAGTVYDVFVSTRVAGDKTLYGSDSGLFLGDPPASNLSTAAALGWSLAGWGEAVLACVRGAKLYYQSAALAAVEVIDAPDKITDMLVSPERQVLAFGCNESTGTFNALCIRGSDLEDYTDWTVTSTNNSFEHILDGGGKIVAGRMVGSYVAVWTETALYLGQFIGDPSQTYRFDKVADAPGPLNARSVIVVNGVAFWWALDLRFYQWSPGSPPVQIPCPIVSEFLLETDEVIPFAWYNTKYNEVWFHYSHASDGIFTLASRYAAYAIGESIAAQRPVWFRGVMTRSFMHQQFGAFGITTVMGFDGTSRFTHAEDTNTNRVWHIQSSDQYAESGRRRIMVRDCQPDFETQSGNVSLTLFMRDRPQSSAVTKGPYTLGTATTKKDFRASGKLIAVKFSGAAGTFARLGKPTFDCVTLGGR